MVSKPDELLPTIVDAGDSGLSIGKITKKFAGKNERSQSGVNHVRISS
jgi:hypothetical protein